MSSISTLCFIQGFRGFLHSWAVVVWASNINTMVFGIEPGVWGFGLVPETTLDCAGLVAGGH